MRPDLLELAASHKLAYECGKAPTKAIAQQYEVSMPTATRWVACARREGFLPTEAPCRPVSDAKLRRVAERIGVAEADLRSAVLDEADGDLRVPRD